MLIRYGYLIDISILLWLTVEFFLLTGGSQLTEFIIKLWLTLNIFLKGMPILMFINRLFLLDKLGSICRPCLFP